MPKAAMDCDGCHTGSHRASVLKPGCPSPASPSAVCPVRARSSSNAGQGPMAHSVTRAAHGVCLGSVPLDDNQGCVPAVQQHIIAMRLNARGVRDTTQVLHINTDTGLSARTQRERAGAVEMKARGSFSGRSKPSGGCGVRSITPQVQSWPMCLGVGRMRAFCSAQRCWSPADSPGVLRTLGGIRTTSRP